MDKWLGDVFGSWPECLDLVAVQSCESVDDDLFGHVELFGHLGCVARPAGYPLKVFKGHQEAGHLKIDLPFYGWRLATSVPVLDVERLVRQEASAFRYSERRVDPDPPSVRGRNHIRVRPIPNDYYVRERAQHAPYILHKQNICTNQ
ncbi:hypothetical protein [Glutamicibacter sp. ZJUTW]|uniref:hypothetical protein n=1 Tax=Glutamicibacter sp. ZJUTW TaxID=1155384 RepID=UPI00143DF9A5|nr:hypothetical protein [Glutamicibacter sp. ZJUTW]